MLYFVTFIVNGEHVDAIIKFKDHFCPLLAMDKLYDYYAYTDIDYADTDYSVFIVYSHMLENPFLQTETDLYLI